MPSSVLARDFDAFLKAWNKLNYDRTKEEQEFCFKFKRQIIPTITRIVEANSYQDALKRIGSIPHNERLELVWRAIYTDNP